MYKARSILIFVAVWECVHADICYDDNLDTLYCDYGCCGSSDDYCCDDTYWGTGSVTGTAIGLSLVCIFVALASFCCCRRRQLGPMYVRQQNTPGVTDVQSNSGQQLNSVAANVAPVYPPPAYSIGPDQPPPYTA